MKNKKVLILLALSLLTMLLTACTYNVSCDPLDLINKINTANQIPGADTLELAQGCTYELTWIEDMTNGNNGLPPILSEITINGNGATIERAENADHFRIFQVGTKASLTLNDLTIRNGYADGAEDNDYADWAGAILNYGNLRLDHVLVTDNYARFVGGIISKGNVNITRSTISHNNADSLTNAIVNYNVGEMEISYSTISENGLDHFGDAIWNNGVLRIFNSTLSGNNGVAIENDEDSSGPGLVLLEYVTLVDNSAALNAVSGNITIRNTLIGPQQSVACGAYIHLTAQNVNMDTDGTCGITTVTPNSLKLGPLADNGGASRTHALGQGSVAIDAASGKCMANDQRGVHRPQYSGCDVGSYEFDDPIVQKEPDLKCTYIAHTNLFCRLGPGASLYPETDSFTPSQEAEVLGISPDGLFLQVVGPVNNEPCFVPDDEELGEKKGACDDLVVVEPPPPPPPDDGTTDDDTPDDEPPDDDEPVEGCTVRQPGGALDCVAPCPAGAAPGDPCTIE
jgi:hypothetical protein